MQNCQIGRIYCLTLGLLKMKWLREHAFLGTKDETTIPFPRLGNRIVGGFCVEKREGSISKSGQERREAYSEVRPSPIEDDLGNVFQTLSSTISAKDMRKLKSRHIAKH